MTKKLSELKPGQKAIIKAFETGELSLKLMEMGCLPGEQIQVAHQAPLGDPISVYVAGYTLSLRLAEADHIFVSGIEN